MELDRVLCWSPQDPMQRPRGAWSPQHLAQDRWARLGRLLSEEPGEEERGSSDRVRGWLRGEEGADPWDLMVRGPMLD